MYIAASYIFRVTTNFSAVRLFTIRIQYTVYEYVLHERLRIMLLRIAHYINRFKNKSRRFSQTAAELYRPLHEQKNRKISRNVNFPHHSSYAIFSQYGVS